MIKPIQVCGYVDDNNNFHKDIFDCININLDMQIEKTIFNIGKQGAVVSDFKEEIKEIENEVGILVSLKKRPTCLMKNWWVKNIEKKNDT